MATPALSHGSGDGGWAWHLVQRPLHERGQAAVTPDLPSDREDATWQDCADVVAAAAGGADDVVAVGHSAGGCAVPLTANRWTRRCRSSWPGWCRGRARPRPDGSTTRRVTAPP